MPGLSREAKEKEKNAKHVQWIGLQFDSFQKDISEKEGVS